jgi:hypothetical protein
MIDLDAARRHLTEMLDGDVEIKDEDVLDAAAAVFAVSPQSEGPGASRPGLATSERTSPDASYRDHQTSRAI